MRVISNTTRFLALVRNRTFSLPAVLSPGLFGSAEASTSLEDRIIMQLGWAITAGIVLWVLWTRAREWWQLNRWRVVGGPCPFCARMPDAEFLDCRRPGDCLRDVPVPDWITAVRAAPGAAGEPEESYL